MNSDDYRRRVEDHRRQEEERAAHNFTPYSPEQMRSARMPWGCWAALVLVAIACVKLTLMLFRKLST